jgi:hypothetical protein
VELPERLSSDGVVPHHPAQGGGSAGRGGPRLAGGDRQGGGAAVLCNVRADLPRLVPEPPRAPQRLGRQHPRRRRRLREARRGRLRIRSRRRAALQRLHSRLTGELTNRRPHPPVVPCSVVVTLSCRIRCSRVKNGMDHGAACAGDGFGRGDLD